MKQSAPPYSHPEGKTYSLFGNTASTSDYYRTVAMIADKSREKIAEPERLIDEIRRFSMNKRRLKKNLKKREIPDVVSAILKMADPLLKVYTENVD